MILNILIVLWAICGTAGAAPQYGPVESTVTVYASCSETPAPFPTAIASDRMAQVSANTPLSLYVAPTASTFSSVGLPKPSWTIEASQSSKPAGTLEIAAEVRLISRSSNDIFSFIVVEGTTSWLNGQTPTSTPSQSFVVITSAVTVVPLSIPPLPTSASMSGSEVVIMSTETVIPLSTVPSLASPAPYSSAKSSGSESVVISTATVIPLSTLPSPQSSSTTSKTKSVSTIEPVVLSTKPATLLPTTSPSSSSVASQPVSSSNMIITLTTTKTTVVPFSTLLPTTAASSKPIFTPTGVIYSSQSNTNHASTNGTIISNTSTFISETPKNAVVSTSVVSFNLSSMTSNLSTIATPISSLSYVSSLAMSRPEASRNSIKPVTSSQSASGRIFTGIASKAGGWNSTSQTISESSFDTHAAVTIGSMTILTGVEVSQAAIQTPNPIFANLTTSTSISSSISLSKNNSLPTHTSTTNSNPISSSTSISGFNATSFSSSFLKSISISILTLVSNDTSTSQSTPASTAASISNFMPVIIRPTSATFPNSTSSTSTNIISPAIPTKCGERGDFLLTFDDIPPLSISNASDTDVQPEPLFNPYHQFLFSSGFAVVPPLKRLPFLPSSKPLLLEFIPNFTANSSNRETGSNAADQGFSGQIGSADEGLTGCFNFNLYGASLGCDSMGPPCDFTFTGYKYDVASKNTSQVTQQTINVPACPELSNCVLTNVNLNSRFKDLTYFFVNVTVAGKPKLWWMDDLRLGWSDNSCAMGLCRQNAHVR